jgi:antitoxin component YwqK of YwqJK toxin-antitoxin module
MVIFFIIVSCKDEETKDPIPVPVNTVEKEVLKKQEEPIIEPPFFEYTELDSLRIKKFNPLKHPYHYGASNKIVYQTDTISSSIVGELKPFETFEIINPLVSYYKISETNIKKWIEVSFKDSDGNIKKGYTFNNKIVHKLPYVGREDVYYDDEVYDENDEEIEEISIDTLYTTNEQEFLSALGSNRVIYVKAKKLDFNSFTNYGNEIWNRYVDESSNFVFQNLDNVEIIGIGKPVRIKTIDQLKQLHFYNCTNFSLNNFELTTHKEIVEYEGPALDAVIYVNSSKNIYLNNLQITESSGFCIDVLNSNNVHVQNSVFSKITSHAVNIKNSFNINLDNNIFKNANLNTLLNVEDGGSISFTNSLVFNNTLESLNSFYSDDYDRDTYSMDFEGSQILNNTFKGNFLLGREKGFISFSDCLISENKLEKHLFVIDAKTVSANQRNSISFRNSIISKNISVNAGYLYDKIFRTGSGYDNPIYFYNTKLKLNTNFKGFIKTSSPASSYIDFEGKSYDTNVYITDSNMTSDNSKFFEGKQYLYNTNGAYSYDNGKVRYKHSVVKKNGPYCFSPSFLKPDWFCCTSKVFQDLENRHYRYAYGELKDGYFEGLWKVVNDEKMAVKIMMELNYEKGVLQGSVNKYIIKENEKILIEKGQILDEKKQGEWTYYYPDGNLRKKDNYNEGDLTGKLTLYYPSGKIMEERDDFANRFGTTKFYYESGQLESAIKYDKKIILEESTFYTETGEPRATTKIPVEKRKEVSLEGDYNTLIKARDNRWRKDIDRNLDTLSFKNGIVFEENYNGYLSGFYSLKEGMFDGIRRCKRTMPTRERITYEDVNNYFGGYFIRFYDQNKIPYKQIVFDTDNDLYQIWIFDIVNKNVVLKQFDGVYGILNIIENYKILADGSLVKYGDYKEYYIYGKHLNETGQHLNENKEGVWILYDNDFEPFSKEVYKKGERISKENI